MNMTVANSSWAMWSQIPGSRGSYALIHCQRAWIPMELNLSCSPSAIPRGTRMDVPDGFANITNILNVKEHLVR